MDTKKTAEFDAVVVGAGVAGLYQLHKLRKRGLNVCVIDAAQNVGGTWYWNCYPGARVDSQSYIYQYWFSEELIKEWNWSERFPAQPETERYLNFVADKLDLRKDIYFETQVTGARWDDKVGVWRIDTDRGDQYQARYFISCTGMLSAPKVPPFPGHENYRGIVAHTARYPREGIDMKGKKVGVVGTGATAIQVIQTIAAEVGELKVFQRTPQYAVAMRNPKFSDEDRAHYKSEAKALYKRVNSTFAGFDFDPEYGSWYEHTPDKRREILEQVWADGSLSMWVGSFAEILSDEKVGAEVSEFVREKIRSRINDPEVAEKLLPRSYTFGTYRVPLELGYYDVYNRDNVELVDVSNAPIECFTETGLKTSAQEYDLDVVILATGFDAGTGSLTRMNIIGRDGVSLTELWGQDIRSTLGLQVHGFPNLFTVAGPLAPSTAFCNMTTCLQQQVDWVSDCIEWMLDNGRCVIEPTQAKQDEWVEHHDDTANATLMMRTNSWYTGANIEGKPRRLLSYIGGANNYRRICEDVKQSGYEGFALT
ncbi:MAG: NAD(P)/FAD-dependent oxidoreductase [Pseudomonadota bacterium]